GGGRQGHGVVVVFQGVDGVPPQLFGVVAAGAHALAAVDAELADDAGLAVPHPDGVGGAALDAVGAALTQAVVQIDGVKELFHSFSSFPGPPVTAAPPP